MLNVESGVVSNSQKVAREWTPLEKGIKNVLVAGFRTHDWIQSPNNAELVGRAVLTLGFGLLERANPLGVIVVKIGVATYLASLESPAHKSLE